MPSYLTALKSTTLSVLLLVLLCACERTVVVAPDAVLPDGSKYLGELKNNRFHGQGKLIYPDGGYYEGAFLDGLFHGHGVLVDQISNRYEGQFQHGRATGKFTVDDTFNKQRYQGDLVDYVYQGSGRLEFGKHFYEGEFDAYRYHGKGTLSVAEGVYRGEFERGVFVEGRFKDVDGNVSEGRFKDNLLHGQGKKMFANGDLLKGIFELGYLTGEGEYKSATRGHYKGNFEYGQFRGQGTYTQTDGAVYVGEFEYGQYHGQGTLTKVVTGDTEPEVLNGEWSYGELKGTNTERSVAREQAELALQQHQALLERVLNNMEASTENTPNAFFIGFAGDGKQSVFRREIEYVSNFFASVYGSGGRSISLINDHETAGQYPLATRLSFEQSIAAVAEKADLNKDVLVVYLTSHGSEEHTISVQHDAIKLPNLSAEELAELLNNSGFKHKLVLVSACYSGGYLPALDDGDTMILTAASADTASFGCTDDADLTYFAKALFAQVLNDEPAMSLDAAFAHAKSILERWENEQDLAASKPQIKVVDKVMLQLKQIKEAQ